MRILLLTQAERLYLPASVATVCRALGREIVAVVAAPAMSTHGTLRRAITRHLSLFGVSGTLAMACRVTGAAVRDLLPVQREGRHFSLRSACSAYGVPYHTVATVSGPEFQQFIDRYRPDLLVSLSCPQIIRKKVRHHFSLGCINVHGAPLPRYRGLMPAFWALRFGETSTAVTVHDLDDKLDSGNILLQHSVPICPDDTWDSLVRKTKAAGAEALIEAIEGIRAGTIRRLPNLESEASYFSFPNVDDRRAFLAAGRRFF